MKKTAAIYVRLSKEDLDRGECESESIQNQKAMLLNYAISRGWQVYNIYCDDYAIIGISRENLVKSRVSELVPFSFSVRASTNSYLKVKI